MTPLSDWLVSVSTTSPDRFCFSEEFLTMVNKAMEFGGGEMPENEGGMQLDFSKRYYKGKAIS